MHTIPLFKPYSHAEGSDPIFFDNLTLFARLNSLINPCTNRSSILGNNIQAKNRNIRLVFNLKSSRSIRNYMTHARSQTKRNNAKEQTQIFH